MAKSNIAAALVAFDSEAIKTLLDEIIVDCDLTFGYANGLRKVTLTDRRDKLMIIGYRPTLTEALSYVLDVWQNVQTVEITARMFASWNNGSGTAQPESVATAKAEAA